MDVTPPPDERPGAGQWRSQRPSQDGTPSQDELQGSYRAQNKSIWSKKCQRICWWRPKIRSSSENGRKYQKTDFFSEKICEKKFFGVEKRNVGDRLKRVFAKFGGCTGQVWGENFAKTSRKFANRLYVISSPNFRYRGNIMLCTNWRRGNFMCTCAETTLTCKINFKKSISKFKLNINSNENESKNATGEDTYAGALRAPRAGSPACVFAFVFVWIHV